MPSPETLIWLATFAHKQDTKPAQKALPWERVAALLLTHEERDEKDGPLFSPALYKKNTLRKKENVHSLYLLVMDFDDGTHWDAFAELWSPYTYLVYTSYSHTTARPRFRAVFPLKEAVKAEDWPRVHRNLVTALGGGHTDPVCKDASRMYYLPAHPAGAIPHTELNAGEWLDPFTFPNVAEPELERRNVAANRAVVTRNSRVDAETLIVRALDRCRAEGRNPAGLWLACQLRDNLYSHPEAETALQSYHGRVPAFERVYEWDECVNALDQAYSQVAREPWEVARPITLATPGANGKHAPDEPDPLIIARQAVLDLKTDRGIIFELKNATALAQIRQWDPANWQRLLADIRKYVSLTDLKVGLDKVAPREEPAEEGEPKPRLAGEFLDECPVPLAIVPHGYGLKEGATCKIVETEGGGSAMATIAAAPILIAARCRDTLTADEKLLLAWRHPGENWCFRLVDRDLAMVSRQLPLLAKAGFPFKERNAKDVADYISDLETANRRSLVCARYSNHLGWQGKPANEAPFLCGATLILPDGVAEATSALDEEHPEQWRPDRVMFHGVGDGEAQIVEAFGSAGSYQLWAQAVKELLPYPRIATMFYAGFCAPLLDLFDVPNFVVDLSHSTSTGKTTSLRLAASVWGNPNENAPSTLLHHWNSTRVYLERVAHVCSGAPVILDDTKQCRKPADIAEIIYQVCFGRGRGRGTIKGIGATLHSRTVVLSTGEQPATSFTQDGGTRTRVLTIRGLPFGKREPETFGPLAKRLNGALCRNYGHAAIRFLSWLMKHRDKWEEWRTRYEEWVTFYGADPGTAEAGRLASYAALVTLAGELAHLALPELGPFKNPMLEIWPEVAAEASDAAGGRRALEDVRSWVDSHEKTFHGRTGSNYFNGQQSGPAEMSGRWDDTEDWPFIAFYPTVLRKVLTELGYPHPDSILGEWREAGWLDCLPGAFTNRVYLAPGKSPRMVAIRRSAFDALELVENEPCS
jgi:hypothetical protein